MHTTISVDIFQVNLGQLEVSEKAILFTELTFPRIQTSKELKLLCTV